MLSVTFDGNRAKMRDASTNATPALLGGQPLLRQPFPPTNTIGAEEIEAVRRVLEGGVLSGFIASPDEGFLGGPEVLQLERGFRERFEVQHAVAMNSATTALHAALVAVGVGSGDEVIVPPTTMSATVAAVLLCGAVPVFADIDEETFNLNPHDAAAKIGKRTSAIIAVNLFGQPAALDELARIARQREIPLVEDNAQSPGALFDGRWAGTIGDVGVFSLNQHKTIHCGEGGVAVTNDEGIAFRLQLVRNHGEVVLDQMEDRPYEALVGSNYRLTEPIAAIANVQFTKLDQLTAWRVELAEQLSELLAGIECLLPPVVHPKATHVYFVYPMRFDAERAGIPRDLFVRALAAENLPISGGYVRPIYLYPVFQHSPHKCVPALYGRDIPDYSAGLCPVAERMYERELLLTDVCRYPLTTAEVDVFVDGIRRLLNSKDALAGGIMP